MRLPNFLMLMLLTMAASCHGQGPGNLVDKIGLSNKLHGCLKLTPQSVERTEVGVELTLKAESLKPLSECLCMSTLMDYSAVDHYQLEGRELQVELVKSFKNSLQVQDGRISLLVASDQAYVPKGELRVSLKCRRHQ